MVVGYALGRGWEQAEPDWEEAVKWYTLAAEQDHAQATHYLGLCSAKGLGVEQVAPIGEATGPAPPFCLLCGLCT